MRRVFVVVDRGCLISLPCFWALTVALFARKKGVVFLHVTCSFIRVYLYQIKSNRSSKEIHSMSETKAIHLATTTTH